MTKTELAEKALIISVGIGTSKIVSKLIYQKTDPMSLSDKFFITAATWTLGAMAADVTMRGARQKISETSNWWNQIFTK